jgi:hypothetical protein
MSSTEGSTSPGPGVDVQGHPVKDPTENVLDIVDAAVKRLDDNLDSAVKRLDDLRTAEEKRRDDLDRQAEHYEGRIQRMADANTTERQAFNQQLRSAETARIDAIRAVDVNAVSRAAEVSAQQAATLAVQVQTSAETLRGQVAAAATATATALATALEPILKRLEELSRVQYEQQGQRAQVQESRGTNQWAIGFAVSAALALISVVGFVIYVVAHTGGKTTP